MLIMICEFIYYKYKLHKKLPYIDFINFEKMSIKINIMIPLICYKWQRIKHSQNLNLFNLYPIEWNLFFKTLLNELSSIEHHWSHVDFEVFRQR